MARVADQANCVKELLPYFDNDTEMAETYGQEESTLNQPVISSPKAKDTHDTARAPAPPAYVRNRGDIIKALRACSNIDELTFHSLPLDHDLRSSRETQVAESPSSSNDQSGDCDMS